MRGWIETPDSSNIQAFRYYPDDLVLVVEFKSGSMYEYSDVPEDVYLDLVSAESRGKFLAANIKNKYEYVRLDQSDKVE